LSRTTRGAHRGEGTAFDPTVVGGSFIQLLELLAQSLAEWLPLPDEQKPFNLRNGRQDGYLHRKLLEVFFSGSYYRRCNTASTSEKGLALPISTPRPCLWSVLP